MDEFPRMLALFFEEMIGRAGGPLNFRLVVMPTVAAFFGIRAGLRDTREGKSTFLWGIITKPTGRAAALRSARKDIGRVFIMALTMDTAYQIIALRAFQIFQVLVVAVACAIVPYVIVRGPVAFVARRLRRKEAT